MHTFNAKNMQRRIIYDMSLMMLSGPMLVVPAYTFNKTGVFV